MSMKKFFLLLILLSAPAFGQILTGGVEYSIETARQELSNQKPITIDYLLVKANFVDKSHKENLTSLLKGKTELKDRTLAIFSDGSYGINYHNTPNYVWYYQNNGLLMNVEIKTSLTFPCKAYKYTPSGELVNKTLRVSEEETFIFSTKGKLIGHWLGKNCYDENGNIIMTRQIKN